MSAPTLEEQAAAFATLEAQALDIAETTDDAEAKALAEDLAVDARHAAARMLDPQPGDDW